MKRKRNRLLYCFAGVACIAMALILAFASPRANNGGHEPVALSKPSGFYDEPFYLELSCDGGTIYYTLDSSDPDENAIPYTEPILIEDATAHENVYCMNRDVALDLYDQLLLDAGFKLRYSYQLPEFPIDKCTVVRAVCVDGEGNRGDVAEAVYFVGFDEKTGYNGFNVITITTDPDNLFDGETGIYVLGKAFADTLVDGAIDLDSSKNYSFIPANYWYKGKDWEKEASVCFFDTDGRLMHSGYYGIRIQGRGSRAMLPKSLNLFARKQYGESAIPCGDILGLDYELNRLNLNMGSNSNDYMLQDYLVNMLCADLDIATREYVPYVLFLDGEYWGLYWLTPRYKADYLSQKYNVYSDNIVAYYTYDARSTKNKTHSDNMTSRNGRVEVGKPEDEALYQELRAFIIEQDMKDPEVYAQLCEMIDVESCADFYATQIYIANVDWPVYNTALWRTRKVASGPYSDCRWRWLLFDVNFSMSLTNAETDTVLRTINKDIVFASLMDSDEFAGKLYDRLLDLAENHFNPGIVDPLIDEYEQVMADAMDKKYMRFYNGTHTRDDFIRGCERIRSFCAGRYAYITQTYGARRDEGMNG